MSWQPDDDSVLSSDGAGSLTVAGLVKGVRAVTADTAAITLAATDGVVTFSTTGAGSFTIAAGTMAAGQTIRLIMTAQSTGTYTMATVFGSAGTGTLTFNAVNEMAEITYDGTTVYATNLNGATVV